MERIQRGDLVLVNGSGDTWFAESRKGNMWDIWDPESGSQMLVDRRQLQKVRRAHPIGTLVRVNSHKKLKTSTIPLGTGGLIVGLCPNPWYNRVQLEDGRVLDLFCGDLARAEEK